MAVNFNSYIRRPESNQLNRMLIHSPRGVGSAVWKRKKLKCSAEIVYTAANAPVHSSNKNNIFFFPGTTPCSGLGDTFFSKGAPEFFVNRRIPIPGELIRDLRSKLFFCLFSFWTSVSRYSLFDTQILICIKLGYRSWLLNWNNQGSQAPSLCKNLINSPVHPAAAQRLYSET